MQTLIVTIATIQDTDFDGNPITIKQVIGTINDVSTTVISSFSDTMSDQECTDAYKATLTSLGYIWDN